MSGIPLKYKIRAIAGAPMRRGARREHAQFVHQARHSCHSCQQDVLQRLLQLNADTAFSRDFGLQPGISTAEFRSRIPVGDYDLIRPYVERMQHGDHRALLGSANELLMYAVTSGTTGSSKLIPVTREFVRLYRRGWQIWGIGAYGLHTVLQRLNIMQISSSHRRFTTADGTPCGNISGLVASMQKRIVRTMYTIPSEVAQIDDGAARRYTILRLALADPHIGMMITANPSTLSQLLAAMDEHAESAVRDIRDGGLSCDAVSTGIRSSLSGELRAAPERARQLDQLLEREGTLRPDACWPYLRLLGVWSGGSVGAYLPALRQQFPNVVVRDHGLHASEGRMTLPLEDESASGILEVNTHYFEFIPIEDAESDHPDVLEAHELQEGREYFILLTTCSGLYRYNIRDVVRCTGFFGQTPLLEFRHKGALISSITGEKIAESQVVEAVRGFADALLLELQTFTMTPYWSDPPGYSLYVGLNEKSDEDNQRLQKFADAVDRKLRSLNVEYDEKRASLRLQPLKIVALPLEVWQRFSHQRATRGGGSPEQYKHPCLLPDPKFEGLFLQDCGLPVPQNDT